MTLRARLQGIIKANINSLLAQKKEPEKVIEETVVSLETNLSQLRQAIASAIATEKRTQRQITQAQAMAQQWYRRAQAALEEKNEALAQKALWQRQSYLRSLPTLQAHYQEQQRVINKLKQDLQVLDLKVSEAKMTKEIYLTRAQSALATRRIKELLGEIPRVNPNNAWENMEVKVNQLESYKDINS
jgi:phage shock protein A